MKGEKLMFRKASGGSEAGKLSLNHGEMQMLVRCLGRVNSTFFWLNLQVTSVTHCTEVTSPGMPTACGKFFAKAATYGSSEGTQVAMEMRPGRKAHLWRALVSRWASGWRPAGFPSIHRSRCQPSESDAECCSRGWSPVAPHAVCDVVAGFELKKEYCAHALRRD